MTNECNQDQIFEKAARAIGKIDNGGQRFISMITHGEIEAMALSLVMLGMRAVYEGETNPKNIVGRSEAIDV